MKVSVPDETKIFLVDIVGFKGISLLSAPRNPAAAASEAVLNHIQLVFSTTVPGS
jgi:hypothetical protein